MAILEALDLFGLIESWHVHWGFSKWMVETQARPKTIKIQGSLMVWMVYTQSDSSAYMLPSKKCENAQTEDFCKLSHYIKKDGVTHYPWQLFHHVQKLFKGSQVAPAIPGVCTSGRLVPTAHLEFTWLEKEPWKITMFFMGKSSWII